VTYTIPPESLAAQVAYCEASVQYTASETGILRQASKRGSIETLARDYATHMLITAANTIAARIDVIREIGIKQPTAEVSHSVHVGSAKTVFLNTMTRSWCGELARACNRTITTYVRKRSCVCVCVCMTGPERHPLPGLPWSFCREQASSFYVHRVPGYACAGMLRVRWQIRRM